LRFTNNIRDIHGYRGNRKLDQKLDLITSRALLFLYVFHLLDALLLSAILSDLSRLMVNLVHLFVDTLLLLLEFILLINWSTKGNILVRKSVIKKLERGYIRKESSSSVLPCVSGNKK
jgi:hypothetical protein